MATHNIVPNTDNDGKLGTQAKRWAEGHFASALKLGNKNVVTDAPNDGRNYIRKGGVWEELQSEGYTLPPITTNNAVNTYMPFGEVAPSSLVAGQLMFFQASITATNELDGSAAVWVINGALKKAFDGNLSISTENPEVITSTYWSAPIVIKGAIDYDTSMIKLVVKGLAGTPILWQASVSVLFSQIATSSFVNFGCTDDACANYSESATADNNTCVYPAEQTSNMFVDISVNSDAVSSLAVVLANQKTGLSPSFNPSVQDYYIQASTYDWANVFYSITVNDSISINGNTLVNKVLRIRTNNNSSTYYVRILPASISLGAISQAPQAGYIPGYYLATNDIFGTTGTQYCSVYDQTGHPVWYAQTDAVLNWSLQPGKEANRLLTNAVGEEHHYALKLKYRELSATSPISLKPNTRDGLVFDMDPHEFLEINTPYTRNGNIILAGYCPETSYGGFYIQEQSPAGDIVWEWFSADYFDATLNSSAATLFGNFNSPEAYHLNSIDVDPRTGNLLISMRACSAVICIEYTTKNVLWGFGGSVMASGGGFPIQSMAIPSATTNTKWLTFTNEPSVTTTLANGTVVTNQYNGTAAQHDVRFRDHLISPLTPGNHVISLYDNQSTDQAPQTSSPQPAYPNTTTPTPRSRACVFEIDLVNNHVIHRSSIFSNASWNTYRKSSFMGSYNILKDVDADGNTVYTHAVNFTNEHPNFKEYIGPIDGTKTLVFSMDMPGVLYRVIKVPLTFFKKENLRAAWAGITAPPLVPAQQPFNPQPLETSIKAYWPLNNQSWTDASGGGFTLTPSGTITNGTGILGADAVLDGSSYLYNNSFSLASGQPFSFSTFFKRTQDDNQDYFLYSGKSIGDLFLGFQNTTNQTIGFGRDQVAWDGTYGFNPVVGTWYHVALVYTGSNISLYLNGEKVIDQDTDIQYVNTDGLYIGAGGNDVNPYSLHGEMQSVGFWNRALHDYEVGMLYSGGNNLPYPFLPTGGLRLWLDAADPSTIETSDGTQVTVWKDKSGNGKNATPLPGSAAPALVNSTSSLGNKHSIAFNNASGNSQILVTDPVYSVGYSQLSAGTIIGVASAASNAGGSGDTGCRWVDLIATPLQSSIGLSVKRLGGSSASFGGYISQSFLAEKPLQNYANLQASLLAAQQIATNQTVTQFPIALSSTPSAAVSIVMNTGGVGSTAIPAATLGLPNSQLLSAFFANGAIKSIVGDNVTFYGQIVDQPTNNGVSVGASIVAGNTVGLRSTLNVAEVLIYDRALSAAEITIVVAYLRAKYGI